MEQRPELLASVRRTALLTFTFTGRARRLELAYFWFVTMLAGPLLGVAFHILVGWEVGQIVTTTMNALFLLPEFALLARRLHDQGRSSWWTSILPPLFAANFYKTLRLDYFYFDPRWPDIGYWQWLLLPFAILYLVFVLTPGTEGPNRFGPDPRQRDPLPPMPAVTTG